MRFVAICLNSSRAMYDNTWRNAGWIAEADSFGKCEEYIQKDIQRLGRNHGNKYIIVEGDTIYEVHEKTETEVKQIKTIREIFPAS